MFFSRRKVRVRQFTNACGIRRLARKSLRKSRAGQGRAVPGPPANLAIVCYEKDQIRIAGTAETAMVPRPKAEVSSLNEADRLAALLASPARCRHRADDCLIDEVPEPVVKVDVPGGNELRQEQRDQFFRRVYKVP